MAKTGNVSGRGEKPTGGFPAESSPKGADHGVPLEKENRPGPWNPTPMELGFRSCRTSD